MNKDEFNNLTIENQVEYINKCLNTNNSSLTKISKICPLQDLLYKKMMVVLTWHI